MARRKEGFVEAMEQDPNMGMSPTWRKKNKGKPKKMKVEYVDSKKKAK